MSFYKIIHVLSGFFTCLASLINPNLVWIGFFGFELYENLQYFTKDDWAVQETLEYMIGFYIGIILLVILKFAGVLNI